MNPEDKNCPSRDLANRFARLPRPLGKINGVSNVRHRAAEMGGSLLVAAKENHK